MAYDYSSGKNAKDSRRSPKLDSILAKLLEYEQAQNIAELLDDEEKDDQPGLKKIGYEVERKYKIDKRSRSDWEESSEKAMNIALQVRQPKNYPFENAANIKYPLVTVAALQFGARAYPAIVDGNRIVKCQVIGSDAGVPMQPMPGQMGAVPGMQMGAMQPGMQGQGMPPQGAPPMPQGGPPVAPNTAGQPPQAGPPGAPQAQQWQIEPGAKRAKADRVSQHMSYQLLNEMEEWEEDTDVLLHHLPIVGCCFRKVWHSEELGRNKSEMVPAIHLVVNNRVRNLNEPVPVTHEIYLYPQEIEERQRSGTFLDVELPAPVSTAKEGETIDADDTDAPHLFLEQHCYWDLDGDGYREPYIVTVHKDTCQVVRLVANYRMENIKHDEKRITRIPKEQYFVKYSFIPDPKGGFYDIGFGRLLESLGETIDTTINQMLDAGHLQNAGGGLISTGIRFKKNQIKVVPGKYEQVETTGKLSDQIHAHQFQGPSPVLFNLLGMMIEAARDITAVKDILTGDTGDKGVQTATTTLALIEQGLKVFTAIYKRVYRALKDEFKLLFILNSQHLDDKTYFTFLDQEQAVAKSDYDLKSMDIAPVADPKMVTDMQRSAKANVLMQIHQAQLPINPVEALKRILDSVGIEEPDKLIVQQQGPSPADQLLMAEKAAQIKATEAKAGLDTATAQKVMVEAQLAPQKAEHEAQAREHTSLMSENAANVEGARLAMEHRKIDAAERGQSQQVDVEREKIAAAERSAERRSASE